MKHPLRHLSSALLLTGGILYSQNLWACEPPVVYGYDDIDCLSDGLAKVKRDGKYGFIDQTGKVVIPLNYDWAWWFSEGLASVKRNGKWGFIDNTGKVVIPLNYDDTWYFTEGLAAVKQNGKYGFINQTGQIIIPLQYDDAYPFYNDVAVVSDSSTGESFYINKQGERQYQLGKPIFSSVDNQ